ncbi:hypothetical protein C7476_105306 [Phyllobacterium bourgognense]|uniref:Uncharacterized protein n=1 Tax=Phyllobacterium bourgognense TaxID=314236 RepID=A0A368YUB4_9HYPH|nr:hypothetical protein C7476_105306 [Phyllobacterium bourgognense]
MTGIACSWIGSTTAFGKVVRNANISALRTFKLTVELLCHGPAPQFEPRFREDIIFIASFKMASPVPQSM